MIRTRADLLKMHRDRDGYLDEDILMRSGLMIEATAAGLRNDGYTISVEGTKPYRKLRIIETPKVAAHRRAAKWRDDRLFESEPPKEKPRKYGDPD